MAYEKQTWTNLPDKTTPATADRMNHIEDGIKDLDITKINIADIVDNLTSTDTDKPLSANQGKVLKETITSVKNKTLINNYIENTNKTYNLKVFKNYLLCVSAVSGGNIIETGIYFIATGSSSSNTSKITKIIESASASVTITGLTLTISCNGNWISLSLTEL